jgi:EpsI family protein
MNRMTIRLGWVIGLVVVVHGGFYVVRSGVSPPKVTVPEWSLEDLPLELPETKPTWVGEVVALDPKIFAATEASAAINRRYHDASGRSLDLHMAMFEDPARGTLHSPTNCYRSSNWQKVELASIGEMQTLKTPSRPEILVKMGIWESEGRRVLVVYWYEVGDYVIFERGDLFGLRWTMRGRETWPPTFKVMIQVPAGDEQVAKKDALEFAALVRDWIGRPGTPSSSDTQE